MIPLQSLPDVFTDPVALAVLTAVILAVVEYQKGLGWYEYRAIHRVKVAVLPFVDRHTSLFVVSRKGGRGDAEYVATVPVSPRSAFEQFVADGWSPHVVNSIKRRRWGNGYQYSVAHLVYFHDDGTQSEVFMFRSGDGGVDVYCHHEQGVQDPDGHLNDTNQRDGDPRGVLPEWVTDV